MMQNKLINRLQTLKAEFESGQKMLAELETKQTNLRHTLLRIDGAIQVLEELLQQESTQSKTERISPEDHQPITEIPAPETSDEPDRNR